MNLAALGSLLGVCPEEGVESERAVHVEPARGQLRQPDLQPVEPVARRAVRRPQRLICCVALCLVILFALSGGFTLDSITMNLGQFII